jgi:hypothetical protein
MPNPTNVQTLKSFIKLCSYYRIYVQDFSTIVHSLYTLLKKDVAWTWSEEAQEAFSTLKEKLLEFPILRRPDFSKVFILHTVWRALGIAIILDQLDEEGKEYVITYASLRTTTFHMRGSVLLLYGPSYISGPIFMAPSSLCILTTSLSNV